MTKNNNADFVQELLNKLTTILAKQIDDECNIEQDALVKMGLNKAKDIIINFTGRSDNQ